MNKLISMLFVVFVAANLAACARAPAKQVYTPDQQRSHSQEAQGELSSEVHK